MLLGMIVIGFGALTTAFTRLTKINAQATAISLPHTNAHCKITSDWYLDEKQACLVPPIDYSQPLNSAGIRSALSDCFYSEITHQPRSEQCRRSQKSR